MYMQTDEGIYVKSKKTKTDIVCVLVFTYSLITIFIRTYVVAYKKLRFLHGCVCHSDFTKQVTYFALKIYM